MHILCIYQYFHTSKAPSNNKHYTYFKHLSKEHFITIITSNVFFEENILEEDDVNLPNVKIIFVNTSYRNEMPTWRRMVAFLHFALGAFIKAIPIKTDLIWGISTPLSVPLIASWLSKIKRKPFLCEIKDLWPDFPIQMGSIRSKMLQKRLYSMESKIYARANHIITSSPDMQAHITKKLNSSQKVSLLLTGTDLDMVDTITQDQLRSLKVHYQLTHKKIVLYAGTFGRANDMPTLIACTKKLLHHQDIQFVFVGFGYETPALQELASQLPNVLTLPPQPYPEVLKWFSLADLSLVTFLNLPVLASNSPAKFFDSLSCGTPVIVTNDGWTKSFVETYQCGWYIPAESPNLLAKKIEQVLKEPNLCNTLGNHGKEIARIQFDRKQIIQPLIEIIEQLHTLN